MADFGHFVLLIPEDDRLGIDIANLIE